MLQIVNKLFIQIQIYHKLELCTAYTIMVPGFALNLRRDPSGSPYEDPHVLQVDVVDTHEAVRRSVALAGLGPSWDGHARQLVRGGFGGRLLRDGLALCFGGGGGGGGERGTRWWGVRGERS